MGLVLVFIGPSGSGKSTVVRELHHRGLIEVTPSWTTRPRRDDELGGTIEHCFVTEEEFSDLEGAGFFLEVVQPFDLPYRYGLPPVAPVSDGRVPAIMVRAPLMPLVVRHFPHRVTYQIEDSYDRATERVVRAGGSVATLGTRLERLRGRAATRSDARRPQLRERRVGGRACRGRGRRHQHRLVPRKE